MKQSIEIIHAGMPLLQWTLDLLQSAGPGPDGSDELIRGLSGLMGGSCSSLMLDAGGSDSHPASRTISCGSLSIFPAARRVTRDGQEIALTPKEFDILLFLAQNRGEVFTKEQIYQAVWEDAYLLDDSNIMAFIRKIRKKIEPNPDAPQYILTIWGIGYKFNEGL